MKKTATITISLVFFSILFLSGCMGSAPGNLGPAIPDRKDRLVTATVPPKLEIVEDPQLTPVVGEVPDELLEAILSDLVDRTDSDRASIEIINAQSVIWSDGSLGCPKPGEFYTQSLVEGYQVVLQIGETDYDYHASDSGYFLLCEDGDNLPVSPPGNPGDGSVPKQ